MGKLFMQNAKNNFWLNFTSINHRSMITLVIIMVAVAWLIDTVRKNRQTALGNMGEAMKSQNISLAELRAPWSKEAVEEFDRLGTGLSIWTLQLPDIIYYLSGIADVEQRKELFEKLSSYAHTNGVRSTLNRVLNSNEQLQLSFGSVKGSDYRETLDTYETKWKEDRRKAFLAIAIDGKEMLCDVTPIRGAEIINSCKTIQEIAAFNWDKKLLPFDMVRNRLADFARNSDLEGEELVEVLEFQSDRLLKEAYLYEVGASAKAAIVSTAGRNNYIEYNVDRPISVLNREYARAARQLSNFIEGKSKVNK